MLLEFQVRGVDLPIKLSLEQLCTIHKSIEKVDFGERSGIPKTIKMSLGKFKLHIKSVEIVTI